MKAASIQEIKQELNDLPQSRLASLCLRLARFKKENKELLTYLLFESVDETSYVNQVKKEMEEQFAEINKSNLYFVKKSLRKIVRVTSRYIRYSDSPETEISLLLHFCSTLKSSGIHYEKSPVLLNMYKSQMKKINAVIGTLHEDLQYEYRKEILQLTG